MKFLALLASLVVLAGYGWLMRVDPTWHLLSPRGGIVMLFMSLALANGAIWLASQSHRALETRFQLAAAGWIWLCVQGLAVAYLVSQAR